MKKWSVILVLLLIPAMCVAAGKKDSGNKELNRYLETVSLDVYQGRLSAAELDSHVQSSFGVTASSIALMKRHKLDPGEVYLVGLIHKATGADAESVLKRRARGKRSWRDVAYFVGSSPDELNALRLADAKGWKRDQHREQRVATKPVVSSGAAPVEKMMTVTSEGEAWDCRCRKKK